MGNRLQIVYKRAEDLKPYERNPRKNDEAVKYVKASIEQFGFKVPIVIDKDGVIVAGHTRWKAALELNMDEVPCIMADDLTPEQIKAFRLADNKTAEMAGWDYELLDFELEDIDFDMSEFGFEDAISPDDFGEAFSLPDSEKGNIVQMTFTLAEEQAELIKYAIGQVKEAVAETFGNNNSNGNGLYEVVRQWAASRT